MFSGGAEKSEPILLFTEYCHPVILVKIRNPRIAHSRSHKAMTAQADTRNSSRIVWDTVMFGYGTTSPPKALMLEGLVSSSMFRGETLQK